jgi:hypothetical protein
MTMGKKDRDDRKPAADPAKKPKSAQDDDLDTALEDSFPASDPPSMTQPETEIGGPHGKDKPVQKRH